VRFETEPGRQLQMDWAVQPTVIAGQPVAVHFAVSTLSYSRRFHFWGTDSEDAEHTYEAVLRALQWFGGVPAEVLVDNQKAAVIAHRRGGAVFESWAHLNQLAERWLREEADPRVHGTVHEVVAERFAREAPTLQPLPPRRYDTAYWEARQVGWDVSTVTQFSPGVVIENSPPPPVRWWWPRPA